MEAWGPKRLRAGDGSADAAGIRPDAADVRSAPGADVRTAPVADVRSVPADRRSAELELLNDVARIATLDLELRPMLQRITDTLARRSGWEFVALVTVDAEHDRFVCEAVTSAMPTAVHAGYMRTLGSGVVGQVAATLVPVVIGDVRQHENYVETMVGTRSEMCVPVCHRGRMVALINLESTRVDAFRGELPLLTTIADQIAGAIANAHQFRELQERARLMEMMSEVSRTALEATDLRELLDRIVRYIYERFPLDRVSIDFDDAAPADAGPRGAVTLDIPIRFQGAILGTLRLDSGIDDAFTPAKRLAFEAFANQMAGAIHLAKVNDELGALSRELEVKSGALEEANEHLANAIETLHRISAQDGLTGVANRRHFDEMLALEWRRAVRNGTPLSLLMLDIDFFKAFNDTAGHQVGDDCLRHVAATLRSSLQRATDLVARYGGEEFVILLPETDETHARTIAGALRERIASDGMVTVSIGVATMVPQKETAVDLLVKRADEALYTAKKSGRNRVCHA
jgi:diguanylate cyclase (GGDEF)-like protein